MNKRQLRFRLNRFPSIRIENRINSSPIEITITIIVRAFNDFFINMIFKRLEKKKPLLRYNLQRTSN